MRRYLFFVILALVQACAARAPRARVVLISVDGLWARDLQRAESAGVRLPTLDSLRRSGELAAGVIGSFPSVTYPSHTTMITGVPPARHGVYANGIFSDPSERRAFNPSYWERSEIRVPTIFDAAARAGLSVAAVFWPVTAHDPSIRYNIPDAWDPRPGAPSQLAALRYLGTPWLLDSIGAPAAGEPNDSMRAAWTAAIIRRWNPDFIALHLIDLDHFKHEYGIWSDSARGALRARDRDISVVLAAVAATEAGRQTTVIVTSDHGFLDYSHRLRPGVLLSRAGLVTVDTAATPPVRAWQAGVQVNGGSVMILPRDSTDPALAARIRAAIPDTLVGPGKPIRAVLPRDTIAVLGGDPRALWALDLNEGFYAISGYAGALLSASRGGGHGYDQRRQELHAFFLMTGPGVPRGRPRPLMRQTEIAGIVARILGLSGF
ncbi:MAG TPA: ectonucleotide pyrophosphatase/phosphodiesterase [Gemmatimonadales bacterium]|nr:ectonucleotide pyrophosphatase/phosphodiesterase [Gemmatimonadales bacterium]